VHSAFFFPPLKSLRFRPRGPTLGGDFIHHQTFPFSEPFPCFLCTKLSSSFFSEEFRSFNFFFLSRGFTTLWPLVALLFPTPCFVLFFFLIRRLVAKGLLHLDWLSALFFFFGLVFFFLLPLFPFFSSRRVVFCCFDRPLCRISSPYFSLFSCVAAFVEWSPADRWPPLLLLLPLLCNFSTCLLRVVFLFPRDCQRFVGFCPPHGSFGPPSD